MERAMSIRGTLLWILLATALLCAPALAQDETTNQAAEEQGNGFPAAKAIAIIGACLGAGLCAVGGGLGIARIGGQCIEAIARQPEAAGAMFAPMIITAAMVEGGMLFAIVVCLLGVLFI